jgi:hypothetical protein
MQAYIFYLACFSHKINFLMINNMSELLYLYSKVIDFRNQKLQFS